MKSLGRAGWMLLVLLAVACNKSEEYTEELDPPVIILDSDTGIYTTKVGQAVTIYPTLRNAEGARYSWVVEEITEGGEREETEVGKEASFTYTPTSSGSLYLIFRVETAGGKTQKELRIDVVELAPPVISFALEGDRMEALAGTDYYFTPDVQHGEAATYEWTLDGSVVGSESSYTFHQNEQKEYVLALKVTNEDGEAQKTIRISVVYQLPLIVFFEEPMFTQQSGERTCFYDQPILLHARVEGGQNPTYAWYLGQERQGNTTAFFSTEKLSPGEYTLTVVVTSTQEPEPTDITRNITRSNQLQGSASIRLICSDQGEDLRYRPASAASSAFSSKVYEYIPAPGQFIQEAKFGFTGHETTPELAARYAEKRLAEQKMVSLGGFGGFITVGFDHSVVQKGAYQGYDFAIEGNQYAGSSEPGIVWVMQDVNGNGLPDDTWYELAGSESGKPETIQGYAVTYYHPSAPGMNVLWSDNCGNQGRIDYLSNFHQQDYYYPQWIGESVYTLRGTCLKARNYLEAGTWINAAYDWGYVDNWGEDCLSTEENPEAEPMSVYFKISRAVKADGTPAHLKYIDFIKVQTGVNAKSGGTGELSTEVISFRDMNL